MEIRHRTQRLSQLIKMRSKIRLDPSWQRGPVWTEPTQVLLIDSILRGYDIPMIYLWDRGDSLPFRYEVVDGQQRLRAIWDFMDGEYTFLEDTPKIGNVRISGKGYDDLPIRLTNLFRNFEVVVAYIHNARQPEISEVFSRMQRGVRLNPAELRNAIQSGLRHAIDSTAHLHNFFENSRIPSSRFKHQDYLAHAISICHHGAARDAKAPQLKDDYIHLTDSAVYSRLISDANDILDFLDTVNQLASNRITQKWIFVDLFYFLYRNLKKLGSIKDHRFSRLYLTFEKDRRQHNAEPDLLIQGRPPQADKDLYDYIIAFKIGGGEKSNIQQRARVIERRFNKPLGL